MLAPRGRPRPPARWLPLTTAMLTTALLACAAPVWAQAPAFATAFTGRTMRVDYFHTLRLGERVVTLDRIVDDGEWAGSRSRLIDDTNLGMYLVEVSDRATNRVLYTRGFSSLANEWETTPAGRHEWRTFHESLRFPWPRGPVQVVLRRRGPDQRFDQIWSVVIDPASRFVNAAPAPPSARTWTLVEHGPASEKVDLLVLGEGYTEAQRPKFHDDVRRLVDELFRYEPFRSRRTDFNVRAIDLPAREPGVHRPQAGAPRRTPLSTEYNIFDSERYLLTQDNRALRDAAAGTPYEFVEILVNESHYGGGGIFNAHATAAADSAEAGYLFVHEFAHHVAGLADEYYTSDVAYETGVVNRPEPWEPNISATSDRERLKWRDLVEPSTPLPTPWPKAEFEARQREYQRQRRELRRTGAPESAMASLMAGQREFETALFARAPFARAVGAFEGAGYEATGLYRSEQDCVMFSRNVVGFCRVCQRAISRVIDLYAGP